MKVRPDEAPRDQDETAFTPILRGLWESVPGLLAAVFVDLEGECIDYVSSVEPYDAKVTAAHLHVMLELVRHSGRKLGLIEPHGLEVSTDERELWIRSIGDDYLLVAMLLPGFDRAQLHTMLVTAGRAFRKEAGVEMPAWEPASAPVEVLVRAAVGWKYAPSSFRESGMRVVVADVLGRWTERTDADDELVCFRVRTEEGRELTLVHDPGQDGWLVRL